MRGHALVHDGKYAAYERLGRNDGRQQAQHQKGGVEPAGLAVNHFKKHVVRARIMDEKGRLPHIAQQKCGKDHAPGRQDGLAPHMPHIGVQGLAARGAQDDLGQHKKSRQTVAQHEVDAIPGVNGLQHRRKLAERRQAGTGQHAEPHGHDRAKKSGKPAAAVLLDGKKKYGHKQGQYNKRTLRDVLKAGQQHQPFHCRKYGDGRSNDAIPHKQ